LFLLLEFSLLVERYDGGREGTRWEWDGEEGSIGVLWGREGAVLLVRGVVCRCVFFVFVFLFSPEARTEHSR
jgi:hypothetical protein